MITSGAVTLENDELVARPRLKGSWWVCIAVPSKADPPIWASEPTHAESGGGRMNAMKTWLAVDTCGEVWGAGDTAAEALEEGRRWLREHAEPDAPWWQLAQSSLHAISSDLPREVLCGLTQAIQHVRVALGSED
jgi:hypothetical protein